MQKKNKRDRTKYSNYNSYSILITSLFEFQWSGNNIQVGGLKHLKVPLWNMFQTKHIR